MQIKYSKLSTYNMKKLLRCFCEDLTATQTANLMDINRNTVNRYYRLFREKIAAYQEQLAQQQGFAGEVELDESYFGGKNKGKRGRGTAKTPVFGIFKRNGHVYSGHQKRQQSTDSPHYQKAGQARQHCVYRQVACLRWVGSQRV